MRVVPVSEVDREQGVRVVSTGHDAAGTGVVASDETIGPKSGPAADTWQAYRLWGLHELPILPDNGRNSRFHPATPPVGGAHLVELVVYPESGHTERRESGLSGYGGIEQVPGPVPGMHYTASVDFVVVLEGEVALVLDGGEEVRLRRGDYLVQNGTRHAWRNDGDVPAKLAVMVLGTEHRGFPGD